MLLLIYTLAQGASIVVNTLADDATVNGNCTLREAFSAASSNAAVDACVAGSSSGVDIITVPAGTITLNGTVGGSLQFSNLMAVSGPTTIRGGTGPAAFNARIFGLSSVTGTTINGLTLTNTAGAIDLYESTLTLNRVSFINNGGPGMGNGAGIAMQGGDLYADRCLFRGNDSSGGGNGGAMFAITGPGYTGARSHFSNSVFTQNKAGGSGGAILANTAASVTLHNVTATGNTSGLYYVGDYTGGAFRGYGGSVYAGNSLITGNQSYTAPSGPYVANDCQNCGSYGYNIFGSGSAVLSSDQVGAINPHDAGNPNGCTDQDGALLTTAYNNVKRHQNHACDVGAVEVDDTDWAQIAVDVSAPVAATAGVDFTVVQTLHYLDVEGTATGTAVLNLTPAASVQSVAASTGSCGTTLPITCNLSKTSAGDVTITAVFRASEGGTYTADATHTVPDPLAYDDVATDGTTVNAVADMVASISGAPVALVGVDYALNASCASNGPSTATSQSTSFSLPAGVTCNAGHCQFAVPGMYTLGVTCSAAQVDPAPDNNIAQLVVNAAAEVNLVVTVDGPTTPPREGEPFTIKVRVSNTGPSPAHNVVVNVGLPNLTVVTAPGPIGDLASGESKTVDYVVTGAPGMYSVTMSAAADEPDSATGDNTSVLALTVDASPATPGDPMAGDGDGNTNGGDVVGDIDVDPNLKSKKKGCAAVPPNVLMMVSCFVAWKSLRRRGRI